jgi:hypothetical protein
VKLTNFFSPGLRKDSAARPAIYHCVTRVVGRDFVFGEVEKEYEKVTDEKLCEFRGHVTQGSRHHGIRNLLKWVPAVELDELLLISINYERSRLNLLFSRSPNRS